MMKRRLESYETRSTFQSINDSIAWYDVLLSLFLFIFNPQSEAVNFVIKLENESY